MKKRIKILTLSLVLLSLTSCNDNCNSNNSSIWYKGFGFICKVDEDNWELKYYPVTSTGVHINSTSKDYMIEWIIPIKQSYYYRSGKYTHTGYIDNGMDVKFTTSKNAIYLSEGTYTLFKNKCPLH